MLDGARGDLCRQQGRPSRERRRAGGVLGRAPRVALRLLDLGAHHAPGLSARTTRPLQPPGLAARGGSARGRVRRRLARARGCRRVGRTDDRAARIPRAAAGAPARLGLLRRPLDVRDDADCRQPRRVLPPISRARPRRCAPRTGPRPRRAPGAPKPAQPAPPLQRPQLRRRAHARGRERRRRHARRPRASPPRLPRP